MGDFFDNIKRLTHDELKTLAALCGGTALLIAVAVMLSGNLPFASQSLKLALQSAGGQAAAVATYGTPGSYTYTVPAGVTGVLVTVVGGGGGGGGSAHSPGYGDYGGGAGGGSGGAWISQYVSVSPGQQISVTVGSGGAGGAGNVLDYDPASNGTGGGTSAFGGLTAGGGGGGNGHGPAGYWAGGGAGGSPGGGRGQDATWYYCDAKSGGSNGTSWGHGGSNGGGSCYAAGNPGQDGYVSIATLAPNGATLSANPSTITSGNSSTLTWTYTGSAGQPASCAITSPSGTLYQSSLQAFNTTGGDQSYGVPSGVTAVLAQLWGSGGGNGSGTNGGAGGYTGGSLAVTPNSTLTVIVGQGGATNGGATYGGGGSNGSTPYGWGAYPTGAGGGRSALRIGGSEVMTAGGGGGGGYSFSHSGSGGDGFAGGGNGSGTGGGSSQFNGDAGGQLGGGGGGGYIGGGASGGGSGNGGGGSGNGGTGFCGAGTSNCLTSNGSGTTPANSGNPNNAGAGAPQTGGRVVLGPSGGTVSTGALTQTTTYTVTCSNSNGTATAQATVTVNAAVPSPTLTITGNGHNPATSVAGQPVTIAATYAAGSGDSLTKTAINDFANNLWCGTGNTCDPSMWTAIPLGQKSYTFTPNTPGTYIFYPAAQTVAYPSWNNWSKSLTLTVTAASCANGANNPPTCNTCTPPLVWNGTSCVAPTCANGLDYTTYGPSCTCPAGQVQNGSVCVDQCTNGAINPPQCDACNPGYHYDGTQCVINACTNGANNPPACNQCTAPKVWDAGSSSCINAPPALILNVAQTRVQQGHPASLSWSVSNLPGDGSITCSITSNPPGIFSASTNGMQTTWQGTNAQTGNINSTTIFTLSCTGFPSISKTVTVVPVVIEK